MEQGNLKVGVLGCPYLSFDGGDRGLLLVAVRVQGTVIMPLFEAGPVQPLRVSDGTQGDRHRFVESVEAGHGNQAEQAAISAAGITTPSLRMDSQAKYAAVAAGQAVLYLRLPLLNSVIRLALTAA